MKHPPLDKILFLDVETVPSHPTLDQLPGDTKELFLTKNRKLRETLETDEEVFNQRAGIQAEFGRLVCVSVGFLNKLGDKYELRITSFYGEDEKIVLQEFAALLHKNEHRFIYLCGHNVKEFDIPFMARRMIIHQVALPVQLQVAGKKPWEVNFIDTMELWKFGEWKAFTSLKLLAHILDIPSPKDDIDGSQVASVYFEAKDLARIVRYCEKDVVATTQVFLRLHFLPLIEKELIS